MDFAYANKFSITVSEGEVFLTFSAVAPKYNAEGSVEGHEIVNERRVVMPKGAGELLQSALFQLLNNKSDGE